MDTVLINHLSENTGVDGYSLINHLSENTGVDGYSFDRQSILRKS